MKILLNLAIEILDYLLANGITITVEYLPGVLIQEVDFQSRSVSDSSELKSDPAIFQYIFRILWTPDIDLFASRVLSGPNIYSMDTRFIQQRDRRLPTIMEESEGLCLPPVWSNRENSDESASRNDNIFSDSSMAKAVVVPKGTASECSGPILLSKIGNLLLNLDSQKHPLIENRTLQFIVWTVSRKKFVTEGLLKKLSHLSQIPEEMIQWSLWIGLEKVG